MVILTETEPIVADITYGPRSVPLFFALSRRRGPWGIQRLHCLPEPPSWKAWLRALIPPWLMGIHYADFAICAGREAERHPLIGPQTEIRRTVAPDVRRLQEVTPTPPHPQPYAVFLDEGIDVPHPDYVRLQYAPPNKYEYLTQLKQLLHAIEQELGVRMVIAMHPCRPAGLGSVWWSFVPATETPNLVAHAALVVAHSSTSVSFAVLLGKPVRILIPDCLKGRPEEANAKAMRAALAQGDYVRRYLDAT